MKRQPVELRQAAQHDIDEAIKRIDIWRVLHGERDIRAWLRGD